MITSVSIAVLSIAVIFASLASLNNTRSIRDLERRLEDLELARDEQLSSTSKISSLEEFERAGDF